MADAAPFAYSALQLAVAWGVSTRHVYDLCASGALGHLRFGRLVRIRQADREAYEAQQSVAPRPSAPTCAVAVPSRPMVRRRDAFQRGKQTAGAKRNASLTKSGAVQ